jgi:hypothetical protein
MHNAAQGTRPRKEARQFDVAQGKILDWDHF